jgi:hypothetical protein
MNRAIDPYGLLAPRAASTWAVTASAIVLSASLVAC